MRRQYHKRLPCKDGEVKESVKGGIRSYSELELDGICRVRWALVREVFRVIV